jgi:hypothetical protein
LIDQFIRVVVLIGVRLAKADTMGLPFVRPYLSGRKAEDFACGANFAVGSATALSPKFFRDRGFNIGDRVHLDMEMKWFRDLLDLLCPGDLAGAPPLSLAPFDPFLFCFFNSTATGEK